MGVNKSFVLFSFLVTSGFLLCTSLRVRRKDRPLRSCVIGIHLGMAYSSVAAYKHPTADDMRYCRPRDDNCAAFTFYDTMELAMNEQGTTTMPSCVAFTDFGVLVGQPAKDQEVVNSERTICGINRLIGKRFDDPEVQTYIKTLPYEVVDRENLPHIEVKLKDGEAKLFSPKEICAMILEKMKEMAEIYMGKEAAMATIIIHGSHFNDEVRQHIREASSMAGLKNSNVVRSTYAAGLIGGTYSYGENFMVLVYDLGGSAFGAFLLELDPIGMFGESSAKVDIHLGGQTFDTRLVGYFVSLIKSKYHKDISKDLNSLRKLRTECEKAKISLSSKNRVMIKIEFSLNDDEILLFEEPLTRAMFEELNMDLFNKTIELVDEALEGGGFEKTDIDEIILVGGSSEIPRIQHLVKNYFGKDPLNVVSPNEALAFAATHFTSLLARDYSPNRGQVHLSPMTVGIETIGGEMLRFVEFHNSILPDRRSRNVTTYYDGQTTVEIKVFEGARGLTKYNQYLGSLQLSNIPPTRRGALTIEVTVEVYEDLKIQVTAEHKATGNKNSMIIVVEEGTLSKILESSRFVSGAEYEEDHKVWRSNELAMTLFQPQPRSMGFAVMDIYHLLRFLPKDVCWGGTLLMF